MTESPSIQVFIADAFKWEARQIKKRYRSIEADLQPLIEQLQNGEIPGDQISGSIQRLESMLAVKGE